MADENNNATQNDNAGDQAPVEVNTEVNAEAGASSATGNENAKPTFKPSTTPDDMVSTVDFAEVKPEQKADEGQTEEEKTAAAALAKENEGKTPEQIQADKAEATKNAEIKSFQDHPDWQKREVKLTEAKTRIAELEEKLSAVPAAVITPEAVESEFSKLSKDEKEDMLEDDPVKFNELQFEHGKLVDAAKATAEATRQQQEQFSQRQLATFHKYQEETPGFKEMWKDGTGPIAEFMAENPGHNAISAHLVLSKADMEKSITEKVTASLAEKHKAAIAKATKDAVETYKIKAAAGTHLSGGHMPPGGEDNDTVLQNTNPHGGTVNVLAKRLAERRAQ